MYVFLSNFLGCSLHDCFFFLFTLKFFPVFFFVCLFNYYFFSIHLLLPSGISNTYILVLLTLVFKLYIFFFITFILLVFLLCIWDISPLDKIKLQQSLFMLSRYSLTLKKKFKQLKFINIFQIIIYFTQQLYLYELSLLFFDC